MTIIQLSKTRSVYWTNDLTKTSDSSPGFTLIQAQDDSAANYGVAEVKGSILNWHLVPYNRYGYYMTTAEMQDMLTSSDKITPIKAKITVGHVIPLAKYPGSTNTLALSFNNTQYGITYHQHHSKYFTPMNEFANVKEFYNFIRTFDGHRWVDNEQNVRTLLPKPNIRYWYPKPDYTGLEASGGDSRISGYAREFTIVKGMNENAVAANVTAYLNRDTGYDKFEAWNSNIIDQPLQEKDLAALYQPEFLQDDANLRALYPGENIDEMEISPSPNHVYTIDNTQQAVNELWTNRDIRAAFHNSNFNYEDTIYLFMNLWPTHKGPDSLWKLTPITTDPAQTPKRHQLENPFQYNNTAPTTASNQEVSHHIGLIDNVMHSMTGFNYKDLWSETLPQLWIKGNPILDPEGALITHTFQSTINWSLTIEVVDKIYRPIRNPCKWGNVQRVAQLVITPGTTVDKDNVALRVKFTKGNPSTLQNDILREDVPIKCRQAFMYDDSTINADQRIPHQFKTQGANFVPIVPAYPETSATRWKAHTSNLPTTSLIIDGGSGGTPTYNLRPRRQSITPKQK